MEIALKNMIVDGVVELLSRRLINEVTDDTQARIVRAGKLQEDPTRDTGINILVWPAEESEPDNLFTRHAQRDSGIHSPSNEVGGGAYFYRRFRIYMLMHFKGFKGDDGRNDARQRAEVVAGRIVHTLLQHHTAEYIRHPVTGSPTDDFNETAIEVQIDKIFMQTSGGSGNFIWKGEIAFGYLTEHLARYYD